MQKITPILIILLGSSAGIFFQLARSADYGSRLEFSAGEVYYKSPVSDETATRLGEYLLETGVFDDTPKTVQLLKSEDVYQFRMVFKEEYVDDTDMHRSLQIYGALLQRDVFDGNSVEMHITDDTLETLRVFSI